MSPACQIAVLLTCHNRRALTLACLAAVRAQQTATPARLRVYLVDDGSTDGTTAAVRAEYPEVAVIPGSGALFWCNGMRLAWSRAAADQPDFYLLLNDDTTLRPNAVKIMFETWALCAEQGRSDSIIVGTCCNPQTGLPNYGGECRQGWHRLSFALVPPTATSVPCETFNGNLALVPKMVYQKIGMLDAFEHSMGDTDYGLRARRSGCAVMIAPGILAECPQNTKAGRWYDENASWLQRWRQFIAPTGLPPRSWLKLTRRHGGRLWSLYFLSPYVRFLLGRKQRLKR